MQTTHAYQGVSNWEDAETKGKDFKKGFQPERHKEAHRRVYTIPHACSHISAQLPSTFDNERSLN